MSTGANSQLLIEVAASGHSLTDLRYNPVTLAYDRAHTSSAEECCLSLDRSSGLLVVRDGTRVFFQGNILQQTALVAVGIDARWNELMGLLDF